MPTEPRATTVRRQGDAAAPHGTPTAGETPTGSSERRAATPQRFAKHAVGGRTTISHSDEARVTPRTPSTGHHQPLLTPRDILSRLRMDSTDPAKWMRRTFDKHGVPYVHTCGKMRATEAQYQMLLERITCSQPVAGGRTAFSISEAQSRSATSGSSSKSSVQERVTAMLRRT